jgi:hypothetical protein
MRVQTVAKAVYQSHRDVDVPASHAQLLDAHDRAVAFRALRIHLALSARHALLQALGDLQAQGGIHRGEGLGVVLAAECGDCHALLALKDEYLRCLASGEDASGPLFQAIASFPIGRILKAVADFVGARGPLVPVPGDLADASAVADILLRAGRATQVLVVQVEPGPGPEASTAEAQLVASDTPRTPEQPLAVVHADTLPDTGQGDLVEAAIRVIAPCREALSASRVALIVGTLLGHAPVEALAVLQGKPPPPGFDHRMREAARSLRFSDTHVVQGAAGASLIALALAQDLVSQGRADAIVICGMDRVLGTVDRSLRMLHCEDRPYLRGGVAALALAPPVAGDNLRVISHCALMSPAIRRGQPTRIALDSDAARRLSACTPERVVATGCTEQDLRSAVEICGQLWPGQWVIVRRDHRMLGAEAAAVLAESLGAPGGTAVVSASALCGTGVAVLS